MNKANKQYKVGGPKEILYSIGICEPRDAENHINIAEDRVINKNRGANYRN